MPRPDLSQQTGNPTSFIHDNYQALMDLAGEDPEAAAGQVINAAEGMVGSGLSAANFRKLKLRFIQAAQRGVFAIQKVMSDYLLGGIDPSLKASKYSRFEDLESVGSLISEDPDMSPVEWTPELLAIKEVVESHGLSIILEKADTRYQMELRTAVIDTVKECIFQRLNGRNMGDGQVEVSEVQPGMFELTVDNPHGTVAAMRVAVETGWQSRSPRLF